MSDEQRVRTMAGWIGVEISKSRVRTAGKAGYGLYRVRAAAERHWHVPHPKVGLDGPWTAYAFELGEIEAAVRNSIEQGRPAGPMNLHLVEAASAVKPGEGGYAARCVVPTRWTPAYGGRRDLGVRAVAGEHVNCAHDPGRSGDVADSMVCSPMDAPVPVRIRPEYAAELTALVGLVDEGLVVMTHVGGCTCSGTARFTAECVRLTMRRLPVDGTGLPITDELLVRVVDGMTDRMKHCWYDDQSYMSTTVRQRQRASNAAFQAEHKARRDAGLRARHAAKLERLAKQRSATPGEP